MTLRPFFCYYGGKWRAAPRYPAPMYGTIIEPFAGAAGYACRYPERQVYLYDADPVIAGMWKWLIGATEADVMALPETVEHVDDIAAPEAARHLIGFWLNKGVSTPCKTPSKWMRERFKPNVYWSGAIKERIASQLPAIRHWQVACRSYDTVPNRPGTWFVDPPYNNRVGQRYRYANVNHAHIGEWCRTRQGQVIVCEQDGADWLPFEPFLTIKGTESAKRSGVSKEVIWTQ